MSSISEIDAVTDEMGSIVATSMSRGSATGYFAAMYLGVTRAVKLGLETGAFATPDRLVGLTTVFARRYLDAWRLREAGRPTSRSWEIAFTAAAYWRPCVLQHLLLGMNAHINLDLGIASAEVAPGAAITELRPDFDEINTVLAGLVGSIQAELNRISPFYRLVDEVGGPTDRTVINFSIARARGEAWKLATVLAAADRDSAARRIAAQDRMAGAIGEAILRPGSAVSSGLLPIRLTELRRPAAIIEIIAGAATAPTPTVPTRAAVSRPTGPA